MPQWEMNLQRSAQHSQIKLFLNSSWKTWQQPTQDNSDAATWQQREDFQTAAAFVQQIAVINDHAEHSVVLIQEYNGKLTQNEEQLQFLLQSVSGHRTEFPDSKKGP